MHKRILLAALLAALAIFRPAHAALSTTNSVVTYTSNGVQTAFAVPFKFNNSSHLVVQSVSLVPTTVTLVLGTDYSVTGAGSSSGGTVTLTAAITNGWTLKIKRSVPLVQGTSLRSQGAFQPKTVEDSFDYTMMALQQMNDGTFTQLLATPVTTAQASMAAPSTIPNSANTNAAGSSASFAAADHVHALAVGPMLDVSTSAGQSIPNASVTIVVFGTVTTDSDSGLNVGTGRYTIPVGKGGDYLITAVVAYNLAQPTFTQALIFKNGVMSKDQIVGNPAAQQTIGVSAILRLAAGDIIDIRTQHGNAAAQALAALPDRNYFALKRIQ
jgi:hypothetical protein